MKGGTVAVAASHCCSKRCNCCNSQEGIESRPNPGASLNCAAETSSVSPELGPCDSTLAHESRGEDGTTGTESTIIPIFFSKISQGTRQQTHTLAGSRSGHSTVTCTLNILVTHSLYSQSVHTSVLPSRSSLPYRTVECAECQSSD